MAAPWDWIMIAVWCAVGSFAPMRWLWKRGAFTKRP